MRAKRIMVLFTVAALMVVALAASGLSAYAEPVTTDDPAWVSQMSYLECRDYCYDQTGGDGGGGGGYSVTFCEATCNALEQYNPGGGYDYPNNAPPPVK
jgi:hypothetical protein